MVSVFSSSAFAQCLCPPGRAGLTVLLDDVSVVSTTTEQS